MLKVLAYTGGRQAPSRAPRVQQYIPHLRREGIEVTESVSRSGSYPPDGGWARRAAWGLCNLAEHLTAVGASYGYDLTLLQREMLSTLVTFEPCTKRPRVLDVDDAIWVHRRGGFARRLARACDHIICGNRFLAEGFARWNPKVSVLPTAVDTGRFVPREFGAVGGRAVIGWLGLSSGFRFLCDGDAEAGLGDVLRHHPEAVLRIVSDKAPEFRLLPPAQVEYLPYSRAREVGDIQGMTIGIMPLDDSDGARGKCSFKMLQYMACGVPAVVSPFGMNAEVLQKGNVGFGACRRRDWAEALEALLGNPELRSRMGRAGRAAVELHYSVAVLAPRLGKILRAQI